MINYTKNITKKKKSFYKRLGFFAVIFAVLFFAIIFLKVGYTFSLVGDKGLFSDPIVDDGYEEKNRIDILILGIRGGDDTEYGGTLADSIMILSIKPDLKKAALISLPRDIYAKIPRHNNRREKINYAYAFGENKGIGGLNLSKQVVESITGIVIDYVVVVDFKTFENLIDTVGGIDIYLKNEFVEKTQWGWEFRLPAGENNLNGKTALYYARSRFSSNDFDRSRRQQDIIVALKNKMLSTGVLTNPLKVNKILNQIGEGVNTNIDFATSLGLLKYVKYLDKDHLIKKVFDTTKNGLLQDGKIDGIYVLYPKAGLDDFSEIKKEIRGIFK